MHALIRVLEIAGAVILVVGVLAILVLVRLAKNWETGE